MLVLVSSSLKKLLFVRR